MNQHQAFHQKQWFLVLGILLVAFNLRPSITAVGPLIPLIRSDLGLSNGWAGFLTTLPLLTFATFSLFSAAIGKRLGNTQAILLGLVLVLAGTIIRVTGGSFWLFMGTALTGIGIVICNVLLIPLIKNRIPHKIGLVTALYTTGMTFFAAVASGVSAPLALDLDLGWRGSLFAWVLLLVLGIGIWLPQIWNIPKASKSNFTGMAVNVWKSRLAWQVSMFMGAQSLLFFTLISWLPDMMIDRGLTPVEAGVLVSLMQIIGLSGSFFAPIIAVKFKDQVPLIWVLGGMYLLGFSSLFSYNLLVNYIGLTLVGLGLGSSVSLAYTLIGLRTKEEKTTASLSGMVQSTGYYLAALGPLLFGVAFDLFHNWDFLIYLMLACSVLFIFFGVYAAKDRKI
jgi:MFS transporter, CP family, cyanate transporter